MAIDQEISIETLRELIIEGFKSQGQFRQDVTARLDNLETRLDNLETRLDNLDSKIDEILILLSKEKIDQ